MTRQGGRCDITMLSLPIADDSLQDLPGRAVYMMAQVRAPVVSGGGAANTSVALAMDEGGAPGAGWRSSASVRLAPGRWTVITHHGQLAPSGEARFGLGVAGSCGADCQSRPPAVEVAHVVVAPIGHEWSRLLD